MPFGAALPEVFSFWQGSVALLFRLDGDFPGTHLAIMHFGRKLCVV